MYLHDLLLVELSLLRQLAKLRHVLKQELCYLVSGEWLARLRLESRAESCDDTRGPIVHARGRRRRRGHGIR